MKFTQETPRQLWVRRVTADRIVIGANDYRAPIALTPEGVIESFSPPDLAELTDEHLGELLADEPEMLIVGTGSTNIFPPRELTFALARRGIGLEFMDTPAAARTYNVLASEGRRLAALLYI